MNHSILRPLVICAWCGAGVTLAGSAGAIVIQQATANTRVHDWCAGPTPGGTDLMLNSSDVGYWPVNSLPGTLEALRWQFGSTTVHNGTNPDTTRPADQVWSFDWGSNLAGTLTVDWYKAYDTNSGSFCYHGAEFDCHYTRAATDPAHVEWVQVFESSLNWSGIPSGTLICDPYPNDGADDAPFYFNPNDVRASYMHVSPIPGGLIFGDTPYVRHEEASPWSGWFRANLFLVSWEDANPRAITVHDGIRWGWDGQCTIPTPASLAALAGCVMAFRRRR